jgi:hypothetical protein
LFQIIGKDWLQSVQTSTSSKAILKKKKKKKKKPKYKLFVVCVKYLTVNEKVLFNRDGAILYQNTGVIQGDKKFSMYLMITVQKSSKNMLKFSFTYHEK